MEKKREPGKRKKPKRFYDDFDRIPKRMYKDLERIDKRVGWKTLYFAIQKYQREMHKDTGYNFNQVKL